MYSFIIMEGKNIKKLGTTHKKDKTHFINFVVIIYFTDFSFKFIRHFQHENE